MVFARSGPAARVCVAVCAFALALPALASNDAAMGTDTRAASEKPRLLVLELKGNGVPPNEVATLNGLLAVLFSEDPTFDVIAGEDLKRLLDLEAERQAMDCSDATCLAEISDAMGAEYVVFGDVGRLDDVHVINLQLYDALAARPLSRTSVHVASLAQASDALRAPVLRLVDLARRARRGEKVESGFVERADRPIAPIALVAIGMGASFAGGAATAAVALLPLLLTAPGIAPEEAAIAYHDAEGAPLVDDVDGTRPLRVGQWAIGFTGACVAALGAAATGYGLFLLTADDEE